jgi:hypothetical protein
MRACARVALASIAVSAWRGLRFSRDLEALVVWNQVSSKFEPGLRHPNLDIENCGPETGRKNSPFATGNSEDYAGETHFSSAGTSRVLPQTAHGAQRLDWLAGHAGLELRNVDANYLFERSHRFAGIPAHSGHRDYLRLR